MSQALPLRAVFQALQAPLELRWLAGLAGAEKPFQMAVDDDPGHQVGRLDWVHPPQIQLLGPEEVQFLETLPAPLGEALVQRLLAPPTVAVLVCGPITLAQPLTAAADAAATALWHTPVTPAVALEQFRAYRFHPDNSSLIHGELLEVFGMGILLIGASGIGKSELALELISRGHRLIADDTPQLTRVAPNVLEGTCPPALRDFLEVRGLGILNVRRLFGDSAIKRNKRVRLLINLVRPEETTLPAELRLHGARNSRQLLGVTIPALDLPIAPGRNLAVLVECAVRDHIQRLNGYHAEQDLAARLETEMAESSVCA